MNIIPKTISKKYASIYKVQKHLKKKDNKRMILIQPAFISVYCSVPNEIHQILIKLWGNGNYGQSLKLQ